MVKLLDSVGKGAETDGFDEQEPLPGRDGKVKAKAKAKIEELASDDEEEIGDDDEDPGAGANIVIGRSSRLDEEQSVTSGESELEDIKPVDDTIDLPSSPNSPTRGRKKDLPATYQADVRSLGWLKVKKDYTDGVEGMGDSLDLVPIGAWVCFLSSHLSHVRCQGCSILQTRLMTGL